MTTEKRSAAARNNGRLSHGPTTTEGKTVSSQNATKFGFFTRHTVLSGESEAEFATFRAGIIESLAPTEGAETTLAGHVADAAWRLRRVVPIEVGVFNTNFCQDQEALTAMAHMTAATKTISPAWRATKPSSTADWTAHSATC